MSQEFNVVVLGASGAVGQTMIEILEERNFPVANLFPLASSRSAGETVSFHGKQVEILDVESFDWTQAQIGFFSAGGDVSAKWAPIAADAGCVVIDNTSHYRYDLDIPLVIPEVNPQAIADFRNRNIIANPNCSTIQMLVALKPIYDAFGISRINVATYQSVSGTGKKAIEELAGQSAKLLQGLPSEPKVYDKQIAFNVLPHIDKFMENGYTKEEMKMVWETQKILGDSEVLVNLPRYGYLCSMAIRKRFISRRCSRLMPRKSRRYCGMPKVWCCLKMMMIIQQLSPKVPVVTLCMSAGCARIFPTIWV